MCPLVLITLWYKVSAQKQLPYAATAVATDVSKCVAKDALYFTAQCRGNPAVAKVGNLDTDLIFYYTLVEL